MDKKTLGQYGWAVVIVIIIAILMGFISPFAAYIDFSIDSILTELGDLTPDPPGIVEDYKGDWTYTINDDGTVTLHQYIGKDAATIQTLTVPNRYRCDNEKILRTVVKVQHNDASVNPDTGMISKVNIFGSDSNTTLQKCIISNGIEMGTSILFNCTALKDVVLSEGSTKIGAAAFQGCAALDDNIVIPDSVINVDVQAFGMSGIKSVKFNDNLQIIDKNAFRSCSQLQSISKFPNTLTKIGSSAFCTDSNLVSSLIIPSSCKVVDDFAFMDCIGLTSVTFENGVEEIGAHAFTVHDYDQMGITEINLCDSITRIESWAFQLCSKATNVLKLPENLTYLGDGAFNRCLKMTNSTLVIPAGVTTIGGDWNSDELQDIGTHNFFCFACKTLTAFEVEPGSENFKAVDGVLFSIDGTRIVSYPSKKADRTYEIPEGVTKIDELAFSNALSLNTLIIPDSFEIKKSTETNMLNAYCFNNLTMGIYRSSGINNIQCKSTNARYTSIDGTICSKDGTMIYAMPSTKKIQAIPSGVTSTFYGVYAVGNGMFGAQLTIPASVTSIDEGTLNGIAEDVGDGQLTVIVDPENTIYKVDTDGCVVRK